MRLGGVNLSRSRQDFAALPAFMMTMGKWYLKTAPESSGRFQRGAHQERVLRRVAVILSPPPDHPETVAAIERLRRDVARAHFEDGRARALPHGRSHGGSHERVADAAAARLFVDADVVDVQLLRGDSRADKPVEGVSGQLVGARATRDEHDRFGARQFGVIRVPAPEAQAARLFDLDDFEQVVRRHRLDGVFAVHWFGGEVYARHLSFNSASDKRT